MKECINDNRNRNNRYRNRNSDNRNRNKEIIIFGTSIVIIITSFVSIIYSAVLEIPISQVLPNAVRLTLSYYIIGAILKFVDDAYDENRFSKKLSVLSIVIAFVIAVWLSLTDKATAIIFLALVIGTTIMGKTKESPFLIGTIAYIGLLFILNVFYNFDWLLFTIIFAALFGDEYFAEWSKHILQRRHRSQNNFLIYFLRDRNIGITVMFILSIMSWLPFMNWLAWLFFDFGYIIVEGISRRENFKEIILRKVFVTDTNSDINIIAKKDIVIMKKNKSKIGNMILNLRHVHNQNVYNIKNDKK